VSPEEFDMDQSETTLSLSALSPLLGSSVAAMKQDMEYNSMKEDMAELV
jgi:hypothetical protein